MSSLKSHRTRAGDLDRIEIDLRMLDGKLISNADASKQIVFGPSNYHWFLSPDLAQGRLVGVTQKIKLPHGGTFNINVGQWIWDDTIGKLVFHGHLDEAADVNATVCALLR